MSGWRSLRHRAAAVAVATLAVVALAACGGPGKAKNEDQASGGNGDVTIGDSPTTPPPAGGTTTPAPAKTTTAPAYPADARTYAQILLRAWGNRDYNRLSKLAIPSAVQQIRDSITAGGVPNTIWTYIRCEGAAGSTYCTFRNANGDETAIRLQTETLGKPNAVTEAPLNRTQFATSPGQYAANFRTAWEEGNQQRMLAYANQTVVGYVRGRTPLSSSTPSECEKDGAAIVVLAGIGADLGSPALVFKLDKTLVASGKKHAVLALVQGGLNPC